MTVLLTRVPPSGRMGACFVVFPMNAIEMPLTYRSIPTSSTNLRSWCPQIAATTTQKLPGFNRSDQHIDSLLASVTLTKQQQFHTVCKFSLALAQYIILTKNYPTNERNLKAKLAMPFRTINKSLAEFHKVQYLDHFFSYSILMISIILPINLIFIYLLMTLIFSMLTRVYQN